jgi:hypothetical protein
VPEFDLLSRLRFEDMEVAITTWLYRRRGPETVLLELPAAARLAGSSLPGSRVTPAGEGVYRLELTRLADPLVRLDVVLPVAAGEQSIPLPRLRDNRGRQGYFMLDRPAGGRVELAAGGGVSRLPVEQLLPALAAAVAGEREVFRQGGDQPLRLTLEPYEPVAAPAAVLDSITCHTAFEENGGSLTVLEMQLEPGGPDAVRLEIPPDASLWYVRLDGDRCQTYRDAAAAWIVPVDPRRAARIEVAFIRRQEPLGLHGRLEVLLPATGLPCRRLCLAVAIPERLQVTSIEGPVTPGPAPAGKAPAEFIGKPHYFSRAFYPGDGLRVALAYAEPAVQQP